MNSLWLVFETPKRNLKIRYQITFITSPDCQPSTLTTGPPKSHISEIIVIVQGVNLNLCLLELCNQEARMNRRGSMDSFTISPVGSLSSASSTGSLLNRANNGSMSPSPFGSCFGSTVDISAIAPTSSQSQSKRKIDSVDDIFEHGLKRGCCHRDIITNNGWCLYKLIIRLSFSIWRGPMATIKLIICKKWQVNNLLISSYL